MLQLNKAANATTPPHRRDKWEGHLVKETDPLNLVIRGHLYVEAELNALLRLKVDDTILTTLKPSFDERLKLAVNLGLLPERLEAPTRYLNSIRNKVAHKLYEDVTVDDAKELFRLCDEAHIFLARSAEQLMARPLPHLLRACITGLILHYSTELRILTGEVPTPSYLQIRWREADRQFSDKKAKKQRPNKRHRERE